ncbi:MAG: GTP 3',8-cyclase MoaA [Anaerolineae bacterium]|nr:GTP 3',8-cyclase MoaA [Anaerolineae bacterium]
MPYPYQDDFGRAINYLRVSVTDRCNLRCVYCMPAEGIDKQAHGEILRYEEIALIVRAAAELGICKVRLTGGEPLARLGLPDLVRMLAAIPGIDDLSMTTNGTLLARHAQALAGAGLRRVNISLDTLDPERFKQITRLGRLDDVLAGMAAAQAAGLTPIKLNMVVLGGINDDEVVEFARRTVSDGWHVRFIELMPIGASAGWAGRPPETGGAGNTVSMQEVRRRIEAELGSLAAVGRDRPTGNGPARYYRLPGGTGTIGFIAAISEHFCHECNRLRLTADGKLRPCLMSDEELDLRPTLRAGADLEAVKGLLIQAIRRKPARHRLDQAQPPQGRTMSEIGG